MRVLAIDESSTSAGVAFLDGGDRPLWTAALRPSGSWPWRRRMRWISDELRRVALERGLDVSRPELVAIEDAVVSRKNPMMGVTVGECRGWTMAVVDAMWPEARIVSPKPSAVRSVVGISAFAGRAHSKDRYRLVATYLGLPATATEDECDAACIGLAAISQVRAEELLRMAKGETT